jgi:hypothetical protein
MFPAPLLPVIPNSPFAKLTAPCVRTPAGVAHASSISRHHSLVKNREGYKEGDQNRSELRIQFRRSLSRPAEQGASGLVNGKATAYL